MARKDVEISDSVVLTDSLSLSVSRDPRWAVTGFKTAVARFRAFEAAANGDGAHHAVFGALGWLDSLVSAEPSLLGDATVKALTFARARSHHHLASIIERPEGSTKWLWRRSSILPFDEKFENAAGKRAYDNVLSGKPVSAGLAAAERAVERSFSAS